MPPGDGGRRAYCGDAACFGSRAPLPRVGRGRAGDLNETRRREVKRADQAKRVAGYRRVSDESQVDGHSLDAQLSEIQRWCD
jgi:hypothetical protein